MSAPLQIGLLLFPKLTQLDLTGPLQVFSSLPGAKLHLIWKRIEPVPSDSVLMLTPTVTFADCPQLDVICVPGGSGTDDLVNDQETLDFLRAQAAGAKYITSVCTGSAGARRGRVARGSRRSGIRFADKDMRQLQNLPRFPFIWDHSVTPYERETP
jgi:cyclohexyl-isocyanide hydratase